MDPQIVLMLAGGTLLLLNGFIGRGPVSSQGEYPEPIVSESQPLDPPEDADRSLLEDWG